MSEETTQDTPGRRTLLIVVSGVLLLAFGWMLANDSLAAVQGSDNAARIGDEFITMSEVEVAAAGQLEQLEGQKRQFEAQQEKQRLEMLKAALGGLVEERLLQMEADEVGVSVEELLSTEVTSKIEPVTEEQIVAFFEQNKKAGMTSVDQFRDEIKKHLGQQALGAAKSTYMSSLLTKYDAEVLLQDPRIDVALIGPSKGPDDAVVTLVEFSDFECPYCARLVPTLKQVEEAYSEEVRIVFRQFPLSSIHASAQGAAEASLCADAQGKFWEMHDAMFANQRALGIAQLKSTAAGLGLDAAAFDECLDSNTFAAQVAKDLEDGQAAGVSGTPAMFINGRFINGAAPFAQVAEVIDEEIRRAERGRR